MRTGTQLTDKWYNVHLVDIVDFVTAETTVARADVTFKVWTGNATSKTTATLADADWKERGDGDYGVQVGLVEWTAAGEWVLELSGSAFKTERLLIEVT